jgi:hypothetical protein
MGSAMVGNSARGCWADVVRISIGSAGGFFVFGIRIVCGWLFIFTSIVELVLVNCVDDASIAFTDGGSMLTIVTAIVVLATLVTITTVVMTSIDVTGLWFRSVLLFDDGYKLQ